MKAILRISLTLFGSVCILPNVIFYISLLVYQGDFGCRSNDIWEIYILHPQSYLALQQHICHLIKMPLSYRTIISPCGEAEPGFSLFPALHKFTTNKLCAQLCLETVWTKQSGPLSSGALNCLKSSRASPLVVPSHQCIASLLAFQRFISIFYILMRTFLQGVLPGDSFLCLSLCLVCTSRFCLKAFKLLCL